MTSTITSISTGTNETSVSENYLINYLINYLNNSKINKYPRGLLTLSINRDVYREFRQVCDRMGLLIGNSRGNVVLEAFMAWFVEHFKDRPKVVQLTLPVQADPAPDPTPKPSPKVDKPKPKKPDYSKLGDEELVALYRKLLDARVVDVVQLQLVAWELTKRGIDSKRLKDTWQR